MEYSNYILDNIRISRKKKNSKKTIDNQNLIAKRCKYDFVSCYKRK